MNVFRAIETLRSVRRYDSMAVENDKLMKALEAARLASSA